ncbi:MAG: amidase [Actinobacteria bacterium]|nr:amidase [Actinomycetota bacterium]
MPEIHDLTALEQGRAIARGELSSVEITRHYLSRSERLDEEVGAFVRLLPELALAGAAAADSAISAGQRPPDQPLFGVVCPVKDLDLVAGVPTSFGNPALEVTLDVDSNVVAALRGAGLVITGKTSTPEIGLPCYTEPDRLPTARNPWDLGRSAAGSSGGAAAAVAAGLAPLAQGSDGGGSIRLPAAVCGLVGIKPSRGRVSSGPFSYGVGDLATSGPLARTVADAAALLDVMSSHSGPGDPLHAPPSAGSFLAAATRAPGRLRIGCYTSPVVGHTEPSADVRSAIDSTVELLTELGHEVVAIDPPFDRSAVGLFEVLWSASAAGLDLPPHVESTLTPLTAHLRERGRSYHAGELAAALAQIRVMARSAILATAEFDAVLSPTATDVAFPVGSMRNDADPAADFEAQKQWASYTAICNVTGQPAINVPLNWSREGLPVGVQLAGRPYDESLIISLSAQLEEARPWLKRHPSLW